MQQRYVRLLFGRSFGPVSQPPFAKPPKAAMFQVPTSKFPEVFFGTPLGPSRPSAIASIAAFVLAGAGLGPRSSGIESTFAQPNLTHGHRRDHARLRSAGKDPASLFFRQANRLLYRHAIANCGSAATPAARPTGVSCPRHETLAFMGKRARARRRSRHCVSSGAGVSPAWAETTASSPSGGPEIASLTLRVVRSDNDRRLLSVTGRIRPRLRACALRGPLGARERRAPARVMIANESAGLKDAVPRPWA
jgi:hypothetical protein